MSRVQMQLRLNFDQRMVYDQTNKAVQAGDVVHLQNRPYYIDEVMLHEECVVLVSMDERQLHREVPAWKIRAYVN
jgi:hypothetical protein